MGLGKVRFCVSDIKLTQLRDVLKFTLSKAQSTRVRRCGFANSLVNKWMRLTSVVTSMRTQEADFVFNAAATLSKALPGFSSTGDEVVTVVIALGILVLLVRRRIASTK